MTFLMIFGIVSPTLYEDILVVAYIISVFLENVYITQYC